MFQPFSIRKSGWLFAIVSVVLTPGIQIRAQTEDGEKIYDNAVRATVWILARHGERTASGTGSLIDKARKLVITNYHVVGDADRVVLVFADFANGRPISERSHYFDVIRKGGGIHARVLHVDTRRDLAVLELEKVPAAARVLRLSSDGARPAQGVHSIGNPGRSDLLWEYTSGTVRQVGPKKWSARDGNILHSFEARVVETQSPTNPGDSGGPLVNGRGELVGITQGIAVDAQLLSLFIDVSEVKSFLGAKKLLPRGTAAVASKEPSEPSKAITPATTRGDEKTEQVAEAKLKLAKTLADDGKLDRAKDRFESIITSYPNTKAAAEAKLLLDKLNK